MRISSELLDSLTEAAKDSPCLRMNYDLRTSPAEGACAMMSVEQGQWHRLVPLKSGMVIFESKDAPYEPLGPGDVME